MKKLSLIAIIALGSLVGFATTIRAAEAGGSGTEGRRTARQDQLETMKKDLNLSDKQVEQLKPILEDSRTKMREAYQDTKLTQEERRAKAKKLQEELTAKIKPILTTEQFQKWEKMREERRQRRQTQ